MTVQLNHDTNDCVQDITDQFADDPTCFKAERKGKNVLIMRRLGRAVERFDKKTTCWQLEYRWLSNELADVVEVQGNEFTLWLEDEWDCRLSLFDQFNLC